MTYNNALIIGRELDKIKGGIYGVKAMDLVRKECELYNARNNKITHQRKYNLYPIFDEDII